MFNFLKELTYSSYSNPQLKKMDKLTCEAPNKSTDSKSEILKKTLTDHYGTYYLRSNFFFVSYLWIFVRFVSMALVVPSVIYFFDYLVECMVYFGLHYWTPYNAVPFVKTKSVRQYLSGNSRLILQNLSSFSEILRSLFTTVMYMFSYLFNPETTTVQKVETQDTVKKVVHNIKEFLIAFLILFLGRYIIRVENNIVPVSNVLITALLNRKVNSTIALSNLVWYSSFSTFRAGSDKNLTSLSLFGFTFSFNKYALVIYWMCLFFSEFYLFLDLKSLTIATGSITLIKTVYLYVYPWTKEVSSEKDQVFETLGKKLNQGLIFLQIGLICYLVIVLAIKLFESISKLQHNSNFREYLHSKDPGAKLIVRCNNMVTVVIAISFLYFTAILFFTNNQSMVVLSVLDFAATNNFSAFIVLCVVLFSFISSVVGVAIDVISSKSYNSYILKKVDFLQPETKKYLESELELIKNTSFLLRPEQITLFDLTIFKKYNSIFLEKISLFAVCTPFILLLQLMIYNLYYIYFKSKSLVKKQNCYHLKYLNQRYILLKK